MSRETTKHGQGGLRLVGLLLAALLVLAACSDSEPSADTNEGVPSETSQPSDSSTSENPDMTGGADSTSAPDRSLPPDRTLEPAPTSAPPVVGEVPGNILTAIQRDAEAITGVAVAEQNVVRAQGVAWNDGSLGCAVPGEAYTDAIVLGYWVEIDAGGRVLDYRAAHTGFFKVCEGPVIQPPPTSEPPNS